MTDEIFFKKVDSICEKEQIKALWRTTFGDSFDYVEAFYGIFSLTENAIVAICGEKVVGMVNSLDCKAELDGDTFHGRYIYALAVDEKYRGRGIAKRLLEMGRGGEFTMLVPENDGLFDMYAHLGFALKTKVDVRFTEPQGFICGVPKSPDKICALVKSENEKMVNAEFFI